MIDRVFAHRLALGLVAFLLGLAALLAPIPQPQHYHRFADTRALALGPALLPNAADVLSSLAFLAAGGAGLALLGRAPSPQRPALGLFFVGLMLTGLGSLTYHLDPRDATLVWDRLAMAVAFAGALGALATERLGPAAGRGWLLGWLALGLPAVAWWAAAGDLRPYLVAQFGGAGVMLLWFRLPPAPGLPRLPWGWLLAAYGVAKACELADGDIWRATGGWLAGHAAKHLVAALGVVPVLWALAGRRGGAAEPESGPA
jgi:hypothetical protein